MMLDQRLEFKVIRDTSGKDADLDGMSVQAAQSFITLIDSLSKIIANTPGSEETQIVIKKGSACVAAYCTKPQIDFIENQLQTVLSNQSVEEEAITPWREFQRLITENGLQYDAGIYKGSEKIDLVTKIKRSKRIQKRPEKNSSDYDIAFIVGKLIEVGGKSPNIHILDPDEKKLRIACTEEQAVRINTFLYKNVYVSTWKNQKRGEDANYQLCDFYLHEQTFDKFHSLVYDMERMTEVNKLVELHKSMRDFIEPNDWGNAKKLFRLFQHRSTPIGILKTLLVITKAFKEDHEFSRTREGILNLLEIKMKEKLK